jgi:predicted Ser/Thr protein kinase
MFQVSEASQLEGKGWFIVVYSIYFSLKEYDLKIKRHDTKKLLSLI